MLLTSITFVLSFFLEVFLFIANFTKGVSSHLTMSWTRTWGVLLQLTQALTIQPVNGLEL